MTQYAINANVAYNYQKNPNSTTTFKSQSATALAMSLRDNPNYNRNVSAVFPTNLTTPNLGAGSPTLLTVSSPQSISTVTYAGAQISGMGEIT